MGSKAAGEDPPPAGGGKVKESTKHDTGVSKTPLCVDTGVNEKKKAAPAGTVSGSTTPVPTSANGGGIDAHPYARGSVIEVLHGVKEESNDHWLSSSSDEDEVENDDKESKQNESSENSVSVRLCDVIDRLGDKDGANWRYYVHYRDFNRRMDEWVGTDRIVAPPSVGNRKARELKKLEEREKRKQARLEERNAELASAAKLTAPRASRRRTSTTSTSNNPPVSSSAISLTTGGDNATSNSASSTSVTPNTSSHGASASTSANEVSPVFDSGTTTPRVTRRRNSTMDGKEKGNTSETTLDPQPPLAAEKEIVTINTTAASEQTTVGEHVVTTVSAQEMDEHEGLDEASLREHEEVTKVKNVSLLELGPHQMETWYFSPLPKELLSERGFVEVLYVCEFSLHMFPRKSELLRYQSRQLQKQQRHPPGNEIYRSGNLSMFEVDGFEERLYCQNLCYIAKLFLDHKTLYFDVDPFLFYVLCEVDNRGYHPVGYFSKEKYSDVGYNLACILTFPSHQRKGYGRFLIAFSYELSKKEEKVGSPEKPMSDLGQQAYKPYWMSTIVDFLYTQESDASSMSIMDISKKTSIMAEDIVFTLNQLGILKIINGVYFVAAEESLLEKLAKKHPVKEPRVDPSKLHWTMFVTDIRRDKFSIHSKKPSVEDTGERRGAGGF